MYTPQQIFLFEMIKSRSVRWAGNVARNEELRNTYRVGEKHNGERQLGRHRRR